MTTQTIRLADLVIVPDLYPRDALDATRVTQLREALDAGAKLPPIVVDGRNHLVDGAHRVAAYRRGAEADRPVACEVRSYASDREFLLDAIRLNASHGKPLGGEDRARCVALAEKHGVSVSQVATALSVTTAKVRNLGQTQAGSVARPSAGPLSSPRQTQKPAARSWRGVSAIPDTGLGVINKAILGLEAGDVDVRDRPTRDAVTRLARVALQRLQETKEKVA